MKEFLKTNYLILSFIILSITTELIGIIALGSGFGFSDPRFYLTYLLIVSSILYLIKNQTIRLWVALILFIVQGIINIFCIVLFEMTGTLFDFGMFKLRNDAMGILESIPLNFLFVFSFGIEVSLFYIFGKRFTNKVNKPIKTNKSYIIPALVLMLAVLLNALTSNSLNRKNNSDYTKLLYQDAMGKYKSLGMTSNFFNELYKDMFYNDVELGDEDKISEFLYSKTNDKTPYYGVSEGNNLITILAESLEWYSFINNPTLYPNGANLNDEQLDYLFPNLRTFYDDSVVCTNYYAREKTDISENLSIVGAYPTNAYINYDFPKNNIPFALPKVLTQNDQSIKTSYFHNGTSDFYNRNTYLKNIVFQNFYADEALYEMGMTNWFKKGNRNLDSEMIEAAKDIMFPKDQRFYTYITSITMHGMYYERANLKKWYEKMDSINIEIKNDLLRNYMAATMEFDHAIGVMINDLKDKDILDKTTIIIFSDHNTYYQGLSNSIKDIYDYNNDNYTNLYRVPMMIRDSNLGHQVIDKFVSTTDIVPTVLDLFGINYYQNFYFGNPIFSNKESIIYSRAYNIFLTDKTYFYSINNLLYKDKSVDEEYLIDLENRAKIHLTKLEYIDKIFYHDFFKNKDHNNEFISKTSEIN